ncbi:AP-1 complex subunit gamma KNAG_0B02160 [Huiozyma naganishii CBS 8797]|uniref:AP-1 complex subunit gamma n=1 Tax=Huiozyma naganishii (strain ATCC MYA-139 / BCRC 22969 / CBS 8797 / KCTC 17520 / NBRC 10181 / NCYC 3082 / Yp74L-3) TaxID=1071383 RepID=J7RGI6_HUIN7|nr:hypothetical protein KNAG_0B02160 [Kazachstania naganishii CBS 8797]CCK68658.1 hypothetical protein KNAG_0B02160 [Kazachstania naganishii CBS 8797]
MAASSLRSFIKDVRAAKTLADERSIVTKQSAKVRTKLRDDHLPHSKRRTNIQKLLYLYILGEKTHFGQVECINLIASDQFVDKRLGYLATNLLLDEQQDLLTLLTNMLNNDLTHLNKYIVSLALMTLGSLSSNELARDLYPDVEAIMQSSKDPFLLKKALQVVAKLICKDASLLEIFPLGFLTTNILSSGLLPTHGVWLGVCKVLTAILSNITSEVPEPTINEIVQQLKVLTPQLLSKLSSLNTKNLEPAFDVQGVQDPFLQCELISTLKWIFKISTELDAKDVLSFTDKFSDLLTQLATNTDTHKNPGQAVLYEITRTIFDLNMSQPLRILGINILGNFLKTGKGVKLNNNIKYVALNTLIDVVKREPDAVQRHRTFISSCLYDPDISIKFRSLELTFAILNEDNLLELVKEIICFLEKIANPNFDRLSPYVDIDDSKDLIVYSVDHLIEKFDLYPESKESEKLRNLFKILGVVGGIINLDTINEFLITINNITKWADKIGILFEMLQATISNDRANIGSQLVSIWCIGEYADILLKFESNDKVINEISMANYLLKLDSGSRISNNCLLIHYVMTAALKLSSKISEPAAVERLRQIIKSHSKDPNLSIQTKSIQYELIFNQPNNVKRLMLTAMPKFNRNRVVNNDEQTQLRKLQHQQENAKSNTTADLLLDLLSEPAPTKNKNKAPAQHVVLPENSTLINESNQLEVYSFPVSIVEGNAHFELYFKNKGPEVTNLQSLCAVPKTQKLILGQIHPSHNDIGINQFVKQSLKISGSGNLKLRVKLSYTSRDGGPMTEQFDHKFNHSI